MDKCGVTHSGIPSHEKKKISMIPLGNVPYYREKNPTVSSGTYLKTKTRNMHQLKSQPKLQSKDTE